MSQTDDRRALKSAHDVMVTYRIRGKGVPLVGFLETITKNALDSLDYMKDRSEADLQAYEQLRGASREVAKSLKALIQAKAEDVAGVALSSDVEDARTDVLASFELLRSAIFPSLRVAIPSKKILADSVDEMLEKMGPAIEHRDAKQGGIEERMASKARHLARTTIDPFSPEAYLRTRNDTKNFSQEVIWR